MRSVSRTGLVTAGSAWSSRRIRRQPARNERAAPLGCGSEEVRTAFMGRRLVPLTLDNLPDLPKRCRACVFWELDPVSGEAAVRAGRA